MNTDESGNGNAGHKPIPDTPATSEALVTAILGAAFNAIISFDERGAIQTINPATEQMFGYRQDELIGQNIELLMPLPDREEHAAYLATGGKRMSGIGREVVGRRKDSSAFPLEMSIAEAHQGDQRLFVGIVRDITERKRMNEEVRAMTQQLWQSAKLASVGELAASIAHELNNPLGTVSLRLDSVLGQTTADDPRRRALEIIAQETKRMGELVANLLQFSRQETDQVSTVDVCRELARALELIDYHLHQRLIHVVQEFAPTTPTIFANRQKLQQVFLNLFTNASDAMPHGGTLVLRTAPALLSERKSAVLIEFADTGVGIATDHLEKVMEPFFTTKEAGSGTGLGLAICRRFVYEHHGTIQIASKLGKGTTVRIVLPVKNDANVNRLHSAS